MYMVKNLLHVYMYVHENVHCIHMPALFTKYQQPSPNMHRHIRTVPQFHWPQTLSQSQ